MRKQKMKIYPSKEKNLHSQVATYLKLQYPKIIFRTDFAAGIKMTIGQAVAHKALQSGSSYPDMFIAQPANGYHGLYMELKRDISEVFKKDGSLRKIEHIIQQAAMIHRLQELGYKALFVCGFDHAKNTIDSYLKNQTNVTDHRKSNQRIEKWENLSSF